MGAKLDKKALAQIATIATPDTVLAWHRTFADQKVAPSEPLRSVNVGAHSQSRAINQFYLDKIDGVMGECDI